MRNNAHAILIEVKKFLSSYIIKKFSYIVILYIGIVDCRFYMLI